MDTSQGKTQANNSGVNNERVTCSDSSCQLESINYSLLIEKLWLEFEPWMTYVSFGKFSIMFSALRFLFGDEKVTKSDKGNVSWFISEELLTCKMSSGSMEKQVNSDPQLYTEDWVDMVFPTGGLEPLMPPQVLSPWSTDECSVGASNYLYQNALASSYELDAALQTGDSRLVSPVGLIPSTDNHQAFANTSTASPFVPPDFFSLLSDQVQMRNLQHLHAPSSPTIPVSSLHLPGANFSSKSSFGLNDIIYQENRTNCQLADAPQRKKANVQTCGNHKPKSNQASLLQPSFVPTLDSDGLITIKSDLQTEFPRSFASSSRPPTYGLDKPKGQAHIQSQTNSSRFREARNEQHLGYLHHALASNHRFRSDESKLVESRDRLLRERTSQFGPVLYKVEHKCRECNISFLSGNALGGHMSSHAKKRKSEAAATRTDHIQ